MNDQDNWCSRIRDIIGDHIILFISSVLIIIIIIIILGFTIWYLADHSAQPGTKVEVLFGMIVYTKKEDKIPVPPPPNDSCPLSKNQITNEQIAKRIMNALHSDDPRTAISILKCAAGSLKLEECNHIYNYCIKNGKYEEAKNVVDQCWNDDEKRSKLDEIKKYSLK